MWSDYSNALIVTAEAGASERNKAIDVFVEEIEKRTGLRLDVVGQLTSDERPVVYADIEGQCSFELGEQLQKLKQPGPEGYRLVVSGEKTWVLGNDQRGLLYGLGYLLRKMRWEPGRLLFPNGFSRSRTPAYPLRGHQLGYRPKTNAYDAWSPAIYDQYIRELALFGANSIELMPPHTDDDDHSVHMKWDKLEMLRRVSTSVHSYGLEFWLWYPNMAEDYNNPATRKSELDVREAVFSSIPYLDHVFIPGSDPGKLNPSELFAWSKEVAGVLRKHHPEAKLWLSPQTFLPSRAWVDAFYDELGKEPAWLDGIVFAPWEKDPAHVLRKNTPKRYPIRNYPDIGHSYRCQYAVPKWDLPMAATLARECINPRPLDQKTIHNKYQEHFIGSLCYSEGINDDVNKFVWLDQEFDPQTPVIDTLRDYARFLIDFHMADDIAQGLLSLEVNLRGPLSENTNVDTCLMQWLDMEQQLSSYAKNNYRFEMGLIRACFDAYLKQRLINERALEREAREVLATAGAKGSLVCMDKAEEILNKASGRPLMAWLQNKVYQLADSLFEHIGAQLTVDRHGAISWDRGAFVDSLDAPLNDARFLTKCFNDIRALKYRDDKGEGTENQHEQLRVKALHDLLQRTNPGPGGFYDNLGTWSSWKRIKNPQDYEKDPGFLHSALATFCLPPPKREEDVYNLPMAWQVHAATMYSTPLLLEYEHLDPQAQYRIKVTYAGHFAKHMKLTADHGKYLIHDFLKVEQDFPILEFNIPAEAYADGTLHLEFSCPDGERGASVAEVWIIKKKTELY